MRLSRNKTADSLVGWKTALFFLAAGVWLAGVVIGSPWLTGAAIAILLVGILLRLRSRAGRGTERPPIPEDDREG